MDENKPMSAAERKPGLEQGYIQVYTGDGKGKTTAALGLAMRAAGRGLGVYIGQFMKHEPSGEADSAARLTPPVAIERFGRPGFVRVTDEDKARDAALAAEGLRRCLEAMLSGQYDIVILDEVNAAVHFGLLAEVDVLAFLDLKPRLVEVVLTGRRAPEAILARADLVTEMVERKHYFARGVAARPGIET